MITYPLIEKARVIECESKMEMSADRIKNAIFDEMTEMQYMNRFEPSLLKLQHAHHKKTVKYITNTFLDFFSDLY